MPTKPSMRHKRTTQPQKKLMLAVVFACEKFRPYILRSQIILHMDHAKIKYFMAKEDAKPRLIRWVLMLEEFDLEIKDKGSDNVIEDHLPRLEEPTEKETRTEIEENFSYEHHFLVSVQIP